MKKQTFKSGDVVWFNSNNIPHHLIEMGGCPDAAAHDGKQAIVEHLETFIELGDKNSEFYTIQFKDGMIWWGISGYHLTLVNTKRKIMTRSIILFIFILLFAMFGESLINWFIDYLINLNP